MAPKRQRKSAQSSQGSKPGKPSGGSPVDGLPQGKEQPPPDPAVKHPSAAPPPAASGQTQAGLDAAQHARAQQAAGQAEILRELAFPASMAEALGLERTVGPSGYKCYLEGLLKDCGDPQDPVERMFIAQLALAHFRIGRLHAAAAKAETTEGVRVHNAAVARLWGEFRRSALALRAYRGRLPEAGPQAVPKLFKLAQ